MQIEAVMKKKDLKKNHETFPCCVSCKSLFQNDQTKC